MYHKKLCSRRGSSFDPSGWDHIFVSQSRKPYLCLQHVICGCIEIVLCRYTWWRACEVRRATHSLPANEAQCTVGVLPGPTGVTIHPVRMMDRQSANSCVWVVRLVVVVCLCVALRAHVWLVRNWPEQALDRVWLCGQILSLASFSEFPEATSFLVLTESSGKFTCFWSYSVATIFLVPTSRTASFCHPRELDVASWLHSFASGFPVLDQSVRQGALSIPMQVIVVGFDSATILSSPSCSCIFFAIAWCRWSSWKSERSKVSWNGWC